MSRWHKRAAKRLVQLRRRSFIPYVWRKRFHRCARHLRSNAEDEEEQRAVALLAGRSASAVIFIPSAPRWHSAAPTLTTWFGSTVLLPQRPEPSPGENDCSGVEGWMWGAVKMSSPEKINWGKGWIKNVACFHSCVEFCTVFVFQSFFNVLNLFFKKFELHTPIYTSLFQYFILSI